eukprot:gene13714-biopygen7406
MRDGGCPAARRQMRVATPIAPVTWFTTGRGWPGGPLSKDGWGARATAGAGEGGCDRGPGQGGVIGKAQQRDGGDPLGCGIPNGAADLLWALQSAIRASHHRS